jgi:hypothetical protein
MKAVAYDLRTARIVLIIAMMAAWLAIAPMTAEARSCVADFYAVARDDYGWNPPAIVDAINNDGDPSYQVANVGDLTNRVRTGELGIFDRNGNFHICS